MVQDISTWEFNWPLLTTFGIGPHNDITKSLAIFRKVVNLVELTIGVRFFEDDLDVGLIHLPHLEYLSICGVEVLAVLDTPALRRLEIRYNWMDDSVVEADETVDFLCRSWLKVNLVEEKGNRIDEKVLLHTSTI